MQLTLIARLNHFLNWRRLCSEDLDVQVLVANGRDGFSVEVDVDNGARMNVYELLD